MQFDYVLAGGGLQSGLIALALRHLRPTARVAVVERDSALGGNHTWSFHAADVPPGAWPVVAPLVGASWPGYRVHFPGHSRTVRTGYHSILSERFDAVVRESLTRPGCELRLNASVAEVHADRVVLAGGEELVGRCVTDARGPRPQADPCGWQTFYGLEVELASPWPDELPTVMDATCPQDGGFRFTYVLPFTGTRVLVEDTTFGDTPHFDPAQLRKRVEGYLAARGQAGWRVLREESGALPMPWSGRSPNTSAPLVAGYAGGWFHPATGYSFPAALRLAVAVASVPPEGAGRAVAALARRLAWRLRFGRFLNTLLFRAVPPSGRWRVFARLYRSLPDAVFARFYSLTFTPADAARMLVGRPPPLDPVRMMSRPPRPPEVAPCPPNR